MQNCEKMTSMDQLL